MSLPINGRWKLVSTSGFQDFLKVCGEWYNNHPVVSPFHQLAMLQAALIHQAISLSHWLGFLTEAYNPFSLAAPPRSIDSVIFLPFLRSPLSPSCLSSRISVIPSSALIYQAISHSHLLAIHPTPSHGSLLYQAASPPTPTTWPPLEKISITMSCLLSNSLSSPKEPWFIYPSPRLWVWLRLGYWHYRSLIDWLISRSLTKKQCFT